MTDHDNPDDVSDLSAGESSSLQPPVFEPSLRRHLSWHWRARSRVRCVVLAALPILVMLWVWLAL